MIPIVAVIVVLLTIVKPPMAVPPMVTPVAPRKFVPVMVITVFAAACNGAKDGTKVLETVGGRVNMVALVALLTGVVTTKKPVVAPLGMIAVMVVLLMIVKLVTVLVAPPMGVAMASPVAPRKLAPVSVTIVPTGPVVGTNEVIDGTV